MKENVYTTAGAEFASELQGCLIIIVQVLYGLKSSGVAWHSHLANTLQTMGFKSSLEDPDVWLCPAVKPNGYKYYVYILVYANDILAFSHDPGMILLHRSDFYQLKDGFDKPTHYLGAEENKWHFPNDPT